MQDTSRYRSNLAVYCHALCMRIVSTGSGVDSLIHPWRPTHVETHSCGAHVDNAHT